MLRLKITFTRIILFLLMLFVACGGEQVNAPVASLESAAANMLHTDSFRVKETIRTETGQVLIIRLIDYQAPDRMRSVEESTVEAFETIVIGEVTYVSHPGRPGYYFEDPEGDSLEIDRVRKPLEAVRLASKVRQDSEQGVFFFSFPAQEGWPTGVGTARLSSGLITSLEFEQVWEGDHLITSYEFSMIGSAPPVRRPSPDSVVPFDSGLPPCPPEDSPEPPPIVCEPVDSPGSG